MVRSTDRPAMTIAVDLGRKATEQTNKSRPRSGISCKSCLIRTGCTLFAYADPDQAALVRAA